MGHLRLPRHGAIQSGWLSVSGPVTPPLEVTEADGSPDGRPITKLVVSSGDLTISGRTATIDTSGSGAPDSAEYLLGFDATIPVSLTAARKLTIGGNISFVHGAGANDDMTIFARASQTGSSIDGQIQYQGASKAFIGIEEFYYDQTNGALRVGNSTTNGAATVTIAADGTGKPVLDLTNASESASLEVTTNQELTIKGGTDTFKFDVSSATGSLTWPDGTSQSTAASGGGGTFNVVLPPTVVSADRHKIALAPPFGGTALTENAVFADFQTCRGYPFIAPVTGDVTEIGIVIATLTTSADCLVGIYSDNSGVPGSLMGYADIEMSASGTVYQTSISATVSLTAGTQYWYVIGGDDTITGGALTGMDADYIPSLGVGWSPSGTGFCIIHNASTTALPATFVPTSIHSTPRPLVSIKIG